MIPSLISNGRELPLVLLYAVNLSEDCEPQIHFIYPARFVLWMFYLLVKVNQALLVISHVIRLYLPVWSHTDKCTEHVTNDNWLVRNWLSLLLSHWIHSFLICKHLPWWLGAPTKWHAVIRILTTSDILSKPNNLTCFEQKNCISGSQDKPGGK